MPAVAKALRSTAKPVRARRGPSEPWRRFATSARAAEALGCSPGQISKAIAKRDVRPNGFEVQLDDAAIEEQGDLPGEKWATHPDDPTLKLSSLHRIQHKNTSGDSWGLRKTPVPESLFRAVRVFVAGQKRFLKAEVARLF